MSAAYRVRSLCLALLAFGAGLLPAGPARAQEAPARVAMVNLLEGHAAVQLAGSDEWVDDLVNRPLASGDRVWVEEGSRAELHVGSTALRLGPRTALLVVAVGDDQVRLRLTAGTLGIRLRSLDDDDSFVVETPAADLELLATGGYRIDADDGADVAHFTVWSGRARVRAPQLLQTLRSDERIDVAANDDYARVARAGEPDRFDLWAEQRDAREDDALAARYVPREMVGYADLDAWGDWEDDPMVGAIWIPRGLAVGWAPFRYGYWSWIGPWGWTWIDDAPWGFAPCHYGRWIRARHGWAWAPGLRREVRRPVFSAAVVTWIGLRPGRDDDPRRSGGRIGWAPLGHVGDPRSATAVDRDTFIHARPVAARRVSLPEAEWRSARPTEAPRVEAGGPGLGRPVGDARRQQLPDRSVFERRSPVSGGTPGGSPPTGRDARQRTEPGNVPGAGIRPRLPDDRRDAQWRDRPLGAQPPPQPAQQGPVQQAPVQQLPQQGYGNAGPNTRPLPPSRDVPVQPVQPTPPAARDPWRVNRDEPVREDRAQRAPVQQAPVQQAPVQQAPVQAPPPMRPIERPAPEVRRQEPVAPSAWRPAPAPQAPAVAPTPPPRAVAPQPPPAVVPPPAPRPHREEERDHR